MRKALTFDSLERREVLSHAHAHVLAHVHAHVQAHVRVHEATVPISTTIPFVTAPTGVPQNAINFTSYRFNIVSNGLVGAFSSGTPNTTQLTNLAHQVPFGVSGGLLATWEGDTSAAQAQTDLVTYLNANIGNTLNVLKSQGNLPTDSLLTYNGVVPGPGQGQNNGGTTVPIDTTIPFVTAPTGVAQNAINFTSNRFNIVSNGLNAAFSSGMPSTSTLTSLAHQVPFGVSGGLLDTWEGDTSASQAQADLVTYLNNNIGDTLNVLKSHINWSTDSLLTYNGVVPI